VANLFERLNKGRPPPIEEAIKEAIKQRAHPTKMLLDWLIYHWAKSTVTAREIYTYGPREPPRSAAEFPRLGNRVGGEAGIA
jgi:hypothetical protein